MLKNLFTSNPSEKNLQIKLDPRPGIQAPPPNILMQWLDEDVEVVDLGRAKRDEVIRPTTWHLEF
jgi:hypothetical protein